MFVSYTFLYHSSERDIITAPDSVIHRKHLSTHGTFGLSFFKLYSCNSYHRKLSITVLNFFLVFLGYRNVYSGTKKKKKN